MSKISCLIDNQTPLTFKDHPNVFSAVLYTDVKKCNLNCYKCHNKAFSKNEKFSFLSYEKLKEKLEKFKLLGVKLIIVCGGEPTLIDYEKLRETLIFIKKFNFNIRVDTNGQNPRYIEKLINQNLVDGFAVDIKIPLSKIKDYYYKILFSKESNDYENEIKKYQKNLKQTLDLISKANLKYNLLRTVKYPLFDNEDLNLIKNDIKAYNIPHQINEFIDF